MPAAVMFALDPAAYWQQGYIVAKSSSRDLVPLFSTFNRQDSRKVIDPTTFQYPLRVPFD